MAQQGEGWKAAAIDDIPPVKADWPATWKSMRHHFGITAFGVNAVTKDAGNVLIPEHGTAETGEQELYIIQRGTARGDARRRGGRRARRQRRRGRRAGAPEVRGDRVAHDPHRCRRHPGKAYEVGEWER